jgi:hypothetical protein
MSAQLATAVSTNDEMEALSRRLCDEVAAWRFEYLPPDVVHTTKLFVLDTLGVIGGGARAPGIPEIRGRMTRWEKDGSATSLIGKNRMSPPHAALVNGATAHALDFDDIHDPARVVSCSSSGLRSRSRVSPNTWSSDAGRQARDGAPSCVIMLKILPPWTCSLSRPSVSTCSMPSSSPGSAAETSSGSTSQQIRRQNGLLVK